MLDRITPLILTFNEAPNIERTLAKLGWAQRIVVVDSGSTDGTLEIIESYSNVEVIHRPFDSFASQCNFGLSQGCIDTDWVLSLDADYVLSDELVDEMGEIVPGDEVKGYRARFRYSIFGRTIRSGIYPPVTVLFKKSGAKFVQDGHAHRVIVEGRIKTLNARLIHDDRKPFPRWLDSQRSYACAEADYLEKSARAGLRWKDRVRLAIGLAPVLMFLHVYLIRGGVFDGFYGLYYALQRAFAELLLSLELLDRKLRRIADD